MDYKMYDNYKDSNEEWIGVIPESWDVKPIREFYDYRSEKVSDKVYEPLSVTKKGILPQLEHAAKTDNNDSRKKVKIGDFVINSRSDRKGSCGVSPYEGSVSLIYHVLRSKDSSIDKYAHHLFRSVMFAEEFYKWGHGIVDDLWSTRWDEMKKIKIPMPPKEERIHIGQYLDKKTDKIIEQIKLNKELIQLLEEKRVALINQVVTKGLNPDVEMKDSGVEWIGKIPVRWNIINLKRFSNRITQGPNPDLSIITDEKKYKILKTKDIYDNQIKYDSADYMAPESFLSFSNFKLVKDDILICIVGKGSIGKVNIFREQKEEFIFTRAIGLLRPDTSIIEPYFVKYFFESSIGKELINSIIEGSTGQEVVKTSTLGSLKITYPPLDEQKSIVKYLDEEVSKIYETIEKITQNIELLNEYKTSLIHHVVTGKIDVRGEEI